MVTLEQKESSIIIRIHETGSFPSGSTRLDPRFQDVMDRISRVLASRPGQITVAGHTDNIPISTGRFRSNWELSSARAVTVLQCNAAEQGHRRRPRGGQGLADTRPLVDNDSPQNRARNRRVELIPTHGIDQDFGDLKDLQLN